MATPVTGYLSRSFAYTPERMWQLVRTVLVPYLIFECVLALFRVHVGGGRAHVPQRRHQARGSRP